MAVHSIKSVQKIPASIERVWDFYSSHANLQMITPAHMKFKIISQNEQEKLHSGQVIEYKVHALFNIPMYWMAEIKNVTPPFYFMDEQRKGPYAAWQHQHFFEAIEGGTRMMDIVLYRMPTGFIGDLTNLLIVKRKLIDIFTFRFHQMEKLFGPWPGGGGVNIVMR
jgi:ligand-binding SRPBCC domain-containing protein